jgi:hypothetical protein
VLAAFVRDPAYVSGSVDEVHQQIIEETKRELGPNLASGWTPGERLRRYAEDIIHGKARD